MWFVQADGPWNHNGTEDLLRERAGKNQAIYVALVDGSIKRYLYEIYGYREVEHKRLEERKLRWDP
jgi:hypothetical protein